MSEAERTAYRASLQGIVAMCGKDPQDQPLKGILLLAQTGLDTGEKIIEQAREKEQQNGRSPV